MTQQFQQLGERVDGEIQSLSCLPQPAQTAEPTISAAQAAVARADELVYSRASSAQGASSLAAAASAFAASSLDELTTDMAEQQHEIDLVSRFERLSLAERSLAQPREGASLEDRGILVEVSETVQALHQNSEEQKALLKADMGSAQPFKSSDNAP